MDTEVDVKICSLNVRGLRNALKRRCIFNWIRQSEFNLILLQETHSTPEIERFWCHEWGFKIEFSHGSSASAGVCILFKPSAAYEILSVDKDSNGRLLLILLKINETLFTVVNIYGPNKDEDSFFTSLQSVLHDKGEEPFIIGGDFNTVINPKVDRYPNSIQNHPNCAIALQNVLIDLELVDIWRKKNEHTQKYTWNSPDFKIGSRIDYFLISQSLISSVLKSDITFGYKTDHSLVSLVLSRFTQKRGPGFWKLNTSLLTDPQNNDSIRLEILNVLDEAKNLSSVKRWEFLKFKVKQRFIQIASNVKNKRNIRLDELEKEINVLEDRIKSHPNSDSDNIENLQSKKKEFEDLQEDQVRGIMIRTKAKWISEGERNTKYFMNLEKRNFQKKCIRRLQTDNGVITNEKMILEEERLFYKKLYSAKEISHDLLKSLENLHIPHISKAQNDILTKNITEEECFEAICSFPNDKTPGSDGLPAEFYKTFWPEIKTLVCSVYSECFKNGVLSPSMRRGIITLLPKKDKDQLFLKNWRPISLLNTDYKILTKVLASRLKKVLPHIINEDQSGFISGRYIGENTRLFIDVLNYCRINETPGIALSIDFEKAFDKVEWDFLYFVMQKFGFNEDFIRWIRVLYTDIEGCVINNGFSSNVFPIECGVRQGCPLSPYLFILAVEILAIMIRQDTFLKGLNIERLELRICQYADDTVLFLKPNEPNLRQCFTILNKFKSMSGLKINIEKCSVIRLGSFNDILCPDIPLAWPTNSISYLGITIPLTGRQSFYEVNVFTKLKEIENVLKVWNLRNLTLYGKIVIIKTLVIPKLIYPLSLLPSPPDSFFSNLQKSLFDFLWNNKGDRIKRSVLYNDYSDGGLKMPHIYSINNAIKIAWVKRYLDQTNKSKWKFFLSKILQKVGGSNFFNWNLSHKDFDFLANIDQFWRDVLLSWSFYKYYNPVKFKDIISQPLWFNSFIRVDNKIIFRRNLFESGVIFVKDICDENGTFLGYNDVINRFGYIPCMQYNSLISAIPQIWKNVIKKDFNANTAEPSDERLNSFLQIKKPTKFCYNQFVKIHCTPISITNQEKWQKDLERNLGTHITWNSRFSLINKSSIDNNLRNFQYKFLHRIVSTNEFLYKIGVKSSPMCNFCDIHTQTMVHLFLKCTIVESFWKDVNEWLTQKEIGNEYLSYSDICFGVIRSKDASLINTIILKAKKYIFLCNYWSKKPSFQRFMNELIRLEKIERCIAYKRNVMTIHTKKWHSFLIS